MKYKNIITPLLLLLGILAVYGFIYPNSMKTLEENDLFLLTPEFFQLKLQTPPCINSWISNFLMQFFCWPIIGALIEGVILLLITLFSQKAIKKITDTPFYLLSAISTCLLIWVFPHFINVMLEVLFFGIIFNVVIHIKNNTLRYATSCSSLIISFFLISLPTITLLYISLAIVEFTYFKNKKTAAIHLICIPLEILLIYIYCQYVYIPQGARYWHVPSVNSYKEWIYLVICIFPIILAFLPKKSPTAKPIIYLLVSVSAVVITLFAHATNSTLKYNEECFKYIQLGNNQEWSEILYEINSTGGVGTDPVRLRYALLAESNLGTLPEKVCNYPINSGSNFLFRYKNDMMAVQFNRQFYASLGIYDEAFHQAFEHAFHQANGDCFSSLRQRTEYAIETGDWKVAEKYLKLLEFSSLHSKFIAKSKQRINQLKNEQFKPDTITRTDNFVGIYQFKSELIRILERNPTNKKVLDYLLITLLLEKNLKLFDTIYHGFPIYKDKELPFIYQQAASMINSQMGRAHETYNYPTQMDEKFKEFYRAYEQGDPNIKNNYPQTYWLYFFMAELPTQEAPLGAAVH